jgi:aminoglycoside 3-N-acetyltransferase
MSEGYARGVTYSSGMSEREVIEATAGEPGGPAGPASRASLAADLHRLGVRPRDILIVHSSLSSMGWVVGGAQAVVEALRDAVGATGTVTMPGHSAEFSEPSHWQHPPVPEAWWPVIRAEMPAFDPALTPTRDMGAVVEAFRHHPNTIRSNHPTMSHLANGPAAQEIIADHSLADGFGDHSPLGRLYDLHARVLLLGVGHANNTSLHLAEHRALWPNITRIHQGSAVLVDGERRWVEFDEVPFDTDDFEAFGAHYATVAPPHTGTVGRGPALLMPMRTLVDLATEWFRTTRH